MAVELASAYVSLTVSADGMRRDINRQFNKVSNDAGTSGGSAGKKFGGKFAAGLAVVGVGAGLALGAAVAKGVGEALNAEAEGDLLAARLGLTDPAAIERVARLQGDIYADAYGESLADVGSAIEAINANVGDISTFDNESLESLAKSGLDVAKIFDEDVNRVIRASGQLFRTGLATDAEQGLDLITAAAQKLPPEFRGELIDSVEEYGSSFAELGFTGEQALGVLTNAVDAGARNTDFAADAFKEFSIRAIDGSKLTSEAYKTLGFDAEQMAQTIAEGGPAAAQATSEIIQAVSGIGDQVLQEQVGVALFGTKFEDLGIDVIRAMDPAAASLGDFAGAAAQAGDTLNDNLATRIEALKRRGFQALARIAAATVIPLLEKLFDLGEKLGPVFSAIGAAFSEFFNAFRSGFTEDEGTPLEGVALALREDLLPVIADAKVFLAGLADTFRNDVLPALQAFATAAVAAFEYLAPIIGPIIGQIAGIVIDILDFVISVITAFVEGALIIWERWGDEILLVAKPIFEAVVGVVRGALDVIQGIIRTVTALIEGDWEAAWEGVKLIFSGVWTAIAAVLGNAVELLANLLLIGLRGLGRIIIDGFNLYLDTLQSFLKSLVDGVRALPGLITSAAKNMWDGLVAPFRSAMDSIRDLWNSTVGGFGFTMPGFLGGGSLSIPTLHDGGIVEGSPSEEFLVLLRGQESVLPYNVADTGALPAGPGQGQAGVNIENVTVVDRPWLEEFQEHVALQPVAA